MTAIEMIVFAGSAGFAVVGAYLCLLADEPDSATISGHYHLNTMTRRTASEHVDR